MLALGQRGNLDKNLEIFRKIAEADLVFGNLGCKFTDTRMAPGNAKGAIAVGYRLVRVGQVLGLRRQLAIAVTGPGEACRCPGTQGLAGSGGVLKSDYKVTQRSPNPSGVILLAIAGVKFNNLGQYMT